MSRNRKGLPYRSIELLNSEGPILTAYAADSSYIIIDERGQLVAIFTQEEMVEYTRGEGKIQDSQGRIWYYMEQPGSMKPDLAELDKFMGVFDPNATY